MLSNIANEPAGRLRDVLEIVQSVPAGHSVSQVWEVAATQITPARGDALSARAEAGALYSAVEAAINSLPAKHERDAFRAYRHTWAQPIFSVGLTDSPNHVLAGVNIVSADAIHTLAMLSSTLKGQAPEPRPRLGDDELERQLDALYESLGRLHMEVSTANLYDARARVRLLQLITDAMETVVFIAFRGYGHLEYSVLAVEAELIGSERQIALATGLPDSVRAPLHERIDEWLSVVRPIVRRVREMIEYDFVPLAGGISAGIAMHDVSAALAAWVAGRVALEGRRPAPPAVESGNRRGLPPGSGQSDENDDQPSSDQATA